MKNTMRKLLSLLLVTMMLLISVFHPNGITLGSANAASSAVKFKSSGYHYYYYQSGAKFVSGIDVRSKDSMSTKNLAQIIINAGNYYPNDIDLNADIRYSDYIKFGFSMSTNPAIAFTKIAISSNLNGDINTRTVWPAYYRFTTSGTTYNVTWEKSNAVNLNSNANGANLYFCNTHDTRVGAPLTLIYAIKNNQIASNQNYARYLDNSAAANLNQGTNNGLDIYLFQTDMALSNYAMYYSDSKTITTTGTVDVSAELQQLYDTYLKYKSSSNNNLSSALNKAKTIIDAYADYYDSTYTIAQISAAKTAIENAAITTPPAPTGPVLPAGYDFNEDSYSFGNFSDKSLSKKYFTSLFQSANAEEIYKANKKAGGLCCGFAYTTASIYNGFPSATSIFNKSITGSQSYIKSLRNAKKSSKITIGSNTISVSDYIKYSYVYQMSEDVLRQRRETEFTSSKLQGYESSYDKNAIFELYDYVKSLSNSNVLGILIWLNGLNKIPGVKNPGCHTVLCVGVDDNCILVDDSNLRNDHGYTDELGKLRINNNGTWIYEPYNGKYNSGNSYISYATDCYKPYSILSTGKKVQADDHWLEDHEPGNSYIVDCEKIDTGKGILYCDAKEYQLKDIERTEFLDSGSGDSNIDQTATLYWVNSEDAISITNIQNSENNSEFHLSSGDTIIETTVANNSSIMFNTDNSLNINSMENDEYSVSYSYCTVDDNYDSKVVEIAISGTASGNTITATQTETGLLVTGISDGTVTLSKDEEVIAAKSVTDAVSDIEITYDKTGADASVELEYEQAECEHIDTDGDGKCDSCGEVLETPADPETPGSSCSCICHNENSIVKFFYVIIRFFWKLFGMNTDCACGVKHF